MSVRMGFVKENAAYGLQSGTPYRTTSAFSGSSSRRGDWCVSVHAGLGVGDEPADLARMPLLGRAEVLQAARILGVVAHQPVGPELADEVVAEQLRQLVVRELSVERVGAEQGDALALHAGAL